jgi:hypothetical protein
MTLKETARLVAKKAKRAGLTEEQLQLVCELADELEAHAGIQAFALVKTVDGSCLTLISMEARYQIWLVKEERESIKCSTVEHFHNRGRLPKSGETTLKCIVEPFDTVSKSRVIYCGGCTVGDFEALRKVILELEGFEIINQAAKTPTELITT